MSTMTGAIVSESPMIVAYVRAMALVSHGAGEIFRRAQYKHARCLRASTSFQIS